MLVKTNVSALPFVIAPSAKHQPCLPNRQRPEQRANELPVSHWMMYWADHLWFDHWRLSSSISNLWVERCGRQRNFGGAVDTAAQRIIKLLRSVPTNPPRMGLAAATPPAWSTQKCYFGITVIISLVA